MGRLFFYFSVGNLLSRVEEKRRIKTTKSSSPHRAVTLRLFGLLLASLVECNDRKVYVKKSGPHHFYVTVLSTIWFLIFLHFTKGSILFSCPHLAHYRKRGEMQVEDVGVGFWVLSKPETADRWVNNREREGERD